MTRDEWVLAFAEQLGVTPPSQQEIDELLSLAGVAAHASERTAAPLSCWIVGRANVPAEQALQIAKRLVASAADESSAEEQ